MYNTRVDPHTHVRMYITMRLYHADTGSTWTCVNTRLSTMFCQCHLPTRVDVMLLPSYVGRRRDTNC